MTWTPPSFSPRPLDPKERIYGRISEVSVYSRFNILMADGIRNEVALKRALSREGDTVRVTELLYDRHKGRVKSVRIPFEPGERRGVNILPDRTIDPEESERLLREFIPTMASFRRPRRTQENG